MADRKDELEVRRWFRQRLTELGAQYPALKDAEHRHRLTEALEQGESAVSPTVTGRPRGCPRGSGQLGEEGQGHKRLTVRLPAELYDALGTMSYTRENPDLAQTVRAALEHYLTCPHRRQRGPAPQPSIAQNGQTEIPSDISPVPQVPAGKSDKATVMARIRQMHEAGLSSGQIAKALQTEGTPTLSGGYTWQPGVIRKLLHAASV
jgi:hypothetical protein